MTSDEADHKYWTFTSHFDHCKVALVMMGVELIDSGKAEGKTYEILAKDIIESVKKQYINVDFETGAIIPLADYSYFYKCLFAEPSKYILPQKDLRAALQKLRTQGKFLFICSNSHAENVELVMTATLGENWRKLFDVIILNASKPKFFCENRPFYKMDNSVPSKKGAEISNISDIKADSEITYLEGNSTLLTEFIHEKFMLEFSEVPKVAFFGDEYVSDINFSNGLEGWDGIAIVEELHHAYDFKMMESKSALKSLDP